MQHSTGPTVSGRASAITEDLEFPDARHRYAPPSNRALSRRPRWSVDARIVRRPIAAPAHSANVQRCALESLMLGTGIECSAVAALIHPDIDLDARTVHAHGETRAGKMPWRDRLVRSTEDWAIRHIAEHLASDPLGERVFRGMKNKHVAAAHRAACSALGIAHSTLHDHRYTYAVQAPRSTLADRRRAPTWALGREPCLEGVRRLVPEAGDYRRTPASANTVDLGAPCRVLRYTRRRRDAFVHARSGNRTHTPLRERDFKLEPLPNPPSLLSFKRAIAYVPAIS
jgi:hypothetical protein